MVRSIYGLGLSLPSETLDGKVRLAFSISEIDNSKVAWLHAETVDMHILDADLLVVRRSILLQMGKASTSSSIGYVAAAPIVHSNSVKPPSKCRCLLLLVTLISTFVWIIKAAQSSLSMLGGFPQIGVEDFAELSSSLDCFGKDWYAQIWSKDC